MHNLRISGATRVFVHPSVLPKMMTAAQEVGLPEDSIYTLEGDAFGRRSLEDMISDARLRGIPRVPFRPVKRDTLAYLVFSSGTSGLPKGSFYEGGLFQTDTKLAA